MGITQTGLAAFAGLIGNTGSVTAFTYLGYGSGTTAFDSAQTALVTEHTDQRAAATVTRTTTTYTNDTLQLAHTFTIDIAETIAECAPFNASSGGIMPARSKLGTSRNVVSGDTWTCTYKIVFA
jgi:hypothetical protein